MHLSHSRLSLWWQLDWFLQSWIQTGISRCWPGWMRTSTDVESFIFTAWDLLRKDPRAGRAARRRYVEETIKQSQESILKGYNFSLSIYLWNSPTFQNSSQPLLVTPPCSLMTRCLGLGISQIYNPQDIYNTAPDDLRATAGGSGAAAREEVKVLWKTHDKRLFSLQMKGAHGDGFRRGFGAEPT